MRRWHSHQAFLLNLQSLFSFLFFFLSSEFTDVLGDMQFHLIQLLINPPHPKESTHKYEKPYLSQNSLLRAQTLTFIVTNEDGFGMRYVGERLFMGKNGALRPQTCPQSLGRGSVEGTVLLSSKEVEGAWANLWGPAGIQS